MNAKLSSSILLCTIFLQLAIFTLPSLSITLDNNGFPVNIQTTSSDPTKSNASCFEIYEFTYEVEVQQNIERTTVRKTENRTRCCQGYTGEFCNISSSSDNACSQLTCRDHPQAVCIVSMKCGVAVPVFINETGVAVDCGNHKQHEELRKRTCSSICPYNPCAGKTCSLHPTAVCLTRGCDCKPIWLLETGIQVDCSTGDQMVPTRKRRQVNDLCSR